MSNWTSEQQETLIHTCRQSTAPTELQRKFIELERQFDKVPTPPNMPGSVAYRRWWGIASGHAGYTPPTGDIRPDSEVATWGERDFIRIAFGNVTKERRYPVTKESVAAILHRTPEFVADVIRIVAPAARRGLLYDASKKEPNT